jgi:hypothetical protein
VTTCSYHYMTPIITRSSYALYGYRLRVRNKSLCLSIHVTLALTDALQLEETGKVMLTHYHRLLKTQPPTHEEKS